MKTHIFSVALAAILLTAPATLPAPAAAQDTLSVAPGLRLSLEDRRDLKRIEDYFNNLTTVRSNFIQASSTGYIAQGMLWIQRPGKVRFEYAPPSPILITADGIWLIYQDNELEQTSRVPLATSAIGVIVDDTVKFDDDLTVEAIVRDANVLRLTVSRDTLLEQGKVTLTFQVQPFELKQWVVEDTQGVEVKVALLDPEFGVSIPAKTFIPNDYGDEPDRGR